MGTRWGAHKLPTAMQVCEPVRGTHRSLSSCRNCCSCISCAGLTPLHSRSCVRCRCSSSCKGRRQPQRWSDMLWHWHPRLPGLRIRSCANLPIS